MPFSAGDELSAMDGLNKEDVEQMDHEGLMVRYVRISGLREKLTEEMHWVLRTLERKKNEDLIKTLRKRKAEEEQPEPVPEPEEEEEAAEEEEEEEVD